MESYLFTSESVTEGHPDKVADAIYDSVLDSIMAQDKNCRVACETLVTTGLAFIAGEITTSCYVDMPQIVRDTIRERVPGSAAEEAMVLLNQRLARRTHVEEHALRDLGDVPEHVEQPLRCPRLRCGVDRGGVPPEIVHESAEQLEHVTVRPAGGPETDPHGRPIPGE